MKNGLFSLAGLFCSVSLLVGAPKPVADSTPKFTWTRGIIQSFDEHLTEVHGIAADPSGNTYVVGNFNGTLSFGTTNVVRDFPDDPGYQSSYFAKFNPGGQLLWVKKGEIPDNNVGGWSVACDKKGNVYFLGLIFGEANFGDVMFPSQYGTVLLKYDANGKLLWSRIATSTEPKKMVIDKDDNILITGWVVFGPANFGNGVVSGTEVLPDFNFFVVKYDSDGNALWAHTKEGDVLAGLSWPSSLTTDKNGDVYVTGGFWGDFVAGDTTLSSQLTSDDFIVKYGGDGSYRWAKQFSDPSVGVSDMEIDRDGHLFIAGAYSGPNSLGGFPLNGSSGAYLAGMTADGNVTWVKQLDNVSPTKVFVGKDGRAYLAGSFGQTASFGPYLLTSNGGADGFLAGVDANGNFSFASGFGGVFDDSVTSLTDSAKGDLYVAGTFPYQTTLGGVTLTSSAGQNGFFSRLIKK